MGSHQVGVSREYTLDLQLHIRKFLKRLSTLVDYFGLDRSNLIRFTKSIPAWPASAVEKSEGRRSSCTFVLVSVNPFIADSFACIPGPQIKRWGLVTLTN